MNRFVHALGQVFVLRVFVLGIVSAIVSAVGCGGGGAATDHNNQNDDEPTRPLTLDAYPTSLVAPSSIDGDFALEQEVTITHADGDNSFRAVLQKRGDELLLVGLGPHGGRAFSLKQRGQETSYESYVPLELPFPPEFMLYDIHRTWFVVEPPSEVGPSNERNFERDGERIHERWRDGRLIERTFERIDGEPAGAIVARYPDGLVPGAPTHTAPPDEVTLDNHWFGYAIRVRTLNWAPLE